MLARFRNPQTTKQEQRYPEVDSFQTYKKPVLRKLSKYNLSDNYEYVFSITRRNLQTM